MGGAAYGGEFEVAIKEDDGAPTYHRSGRSNKSGGSRASTRPKGSKKSKNSGGTTDTKTGSSRSVRQIRAVLEVNNLMIDDENGLESFEVYEKQALEIVNEDRQSAMKREQQEKFLKQRKKNELRPEMTFVEAMWKLIILEDRSIKKEDEHTVVNEGLFVKS